MNPKTTPPKICSNSINMLELNRMIMLPSEPRNSESKAISKSIKYIKNNYKDVDWLLSFSDGKENNVGYIYQATNWLYLGFVLSRSFYRIDENDIHIITLWHRYKENAKTKETLNQLLSKDDNLKNVTHIRCKQHVYVMSLKKHIKFNFTNKPYPKMEKEIPVLDERVIKINGTPVIDPKWNNGNTKYEHQISC